MLTHIRDTHTADSYSSILVLAIVRAPTAVIISIPAAKAPATIATIRATLMRARALVTQPAQSTILAILATVLKLVQLSGVAAKALLMVLGREALTALAERVVGSGSGAARLGSECRRAGSAALGLAKGLQGVLARALLAALLLAVRGSLIGIALGAAEAFGEAAETACRGAVLALGSGS